MPSASASGTTRTKKETLSRLVIVESPSKASTIKKYLGRNYTVLASVGHIIDLPKSRLGVRVDEDFEPDYIVMRDKSKIMKELRAAVKDASEVILASDPDREGEAIAWHLKNDFESRVLPKIKKRTVPIKRIRFEEITQPAVLEAIQHPMDIDDRLVQAQQGRRVIDRLFGYELSPLLWKKVKSKLSAGRVQSIALRIICEREEEIERFIPQEYWDFLVDFKAGKAVFQAELTKIDGKKAEISDEATALRVEQELQQGDSTISDIRNRTMSRKPQPPFITSTLQQAANNLLGYPSAKTMRVAQQLYEGVDLGSSRTGLITYMRTDSQRISPLALDMVREYIRQELGPAYLPETAHFYKNRKSAQDAHEAIRPTDVSLHPDKIKAHLSGEQFKIYNLIWRRFVASQMTASQSDLYTIEITNTNKTLTASRSEQTFDGYNRIYNFSKSQKEKKLPQDLVAGTPLNIEKISKEQKFTDPPPRYTDASLVKIMEELGIGRPSTYAPTIFTLTKRYYIKKDGKALQPTELGKVVNRLLVDNFPDLINVKFTAAMEEELDEVEEGSKAWKSVVRDFYTPFSQVLKHAYEHIDDIKGSFDEVTEHVCEVCGKTMVKKLGKFGYFLACSGWPDCRNTKAIPLGLCPKCTTGQVVAKKGKRGRSFYGCSRYPECDFATYLTPSDEKSPEDNSVLFIKKEKGQAKLVSLAEGSVYEKDID